MIEGSCLCGGVKFEIDEQDILVIDNRHCSHQICIRKFVACLGAADAGR